MKFGIIQIEIITKAIFSTRKRKKHRAIKTTKKTIASRLLASGELLLTDKQVLVSATPQKYCIEQFATNNKARNNTLLLITFKTSH